MNLYPASKYGVDSESLALSVSRLCAASTVASANLFTQICFAWLTGNGDLHAKNISIPGEASGEFWVSPMYDIPSTLSYGDTEMAISLAGSREGITAKKAPRIC